MPMTPQRIQDGKNDPRMFKEGAREQPVSNTIAAMHDAMGAFLKRPEPGDDCDVGFISRDLPEKQIAGLVGESGHSSQQLSARGDVSSPRIRQGPLRGDDIDLAAQTVLVRLLRG